MTRVLEVLQEYLLFSTDVKLAVENFPLLTEFDSYS